MTTHLSKAEAALATVKTPEQLDEWHDAWMAGEDYASMPDADAKVLERLYQAAHARVHFPGALVG